jgi:tRNA (guanine6-N2)-methyltransferase
MLYEAEFLEGLKPFVNNEISNRLKAEILRTRSTSIVFRYNGNPQKLFDLKTVVAVYRLLQFDIPRPKALLGHEHFTILLETIEDICSDKPFASFRFSAAGKDSSVFERLRADIARETGFAIEPDEADLLIRIRKAIIEPSGWEALLRITPRPLATRSWRVCDMRGAVNATIAACMIEMTFPDTEDHFLNFMCGSATLLIERANRLPVRSIVGVEHDPQVLKCAKQNITAALTPVPIDLVESDARSMDFPDDHFTALVADLPWGQEFGAHEYNAELYPSVLQEAARVATSGARLVLLSHEVRLMESVIEQLSDLWHLKRTVKVFQGGLHPRLYALERK